jgi:TatD DNase family protein
MLGIGGVLTFKKSKLPETLRNAVPLSRIVLETDAPYMAPVPFRGKRNESSFIPYIIKTLAEVYSTSAENITDITTQNAKTIFPI